jgi:RimJ/RimL family protein N-acetyltransferase
MLLTLPDGARIIVRAIVPEDKPLLVAALNGLSARSTFQRFLSPKVRFTEAELRYLTEVDQRDHIALIAILADGPRVPVAVARCVRVAPDTAELAIVVGDRWQGLGLGKQLTAELARRASAEGIRKISGTMLADNRRAFRLMRASFRTPFDADSISSGIREIVARLAVA